jgi:hypothetical protein
MGLLTMCSTLALTMLRPASAKVQYPDLTRPDKTSASVELHRQRTWVLLPG